MSKYSEALELSEDERKKLAEEIDYEKRRMTQPEGQPTTMTVREQLEANGLKHLYDMRTLDRDSRSYGERVEDILTTLISNAKEEERRSIAKDFQESSGICSMHQLPDRSCRICFPLSSNNPKV